MTMSVDYKIVTGVEAREVVKRMISVSRSGSEVCRAVDAFFQFIDEYNIDVSRQPVALVDGKIVGYGMVLVNPGAMAGILLPQQLPELWGVDELSYRQIMVGLVRWVAEQIEPWDLAILQAILSSKDEDSFDSILCEGGFSHLCDLTIMESLAKINPSTMRNDDVEWVPFDESLSPRFEEVILQSYEASKDCPLLTGLRTGGEVLEGHRWSGIFLRKGWWLMRYRGRDAGVILLNGSQEQADRLELIYMGLTPQFRGLGLGRILLSRAFEAAESLNKNVIRLAVDRNNIYTKQLYEQMGFEQIDHQVVLAILNEKRRHRLRGK